MDVGKIRGDFPIFAQTDRGRPLCYLDSAATSQKPRSVIDAEAEFYRTVNANVHRGVYRLSEAATDAYEQARETVAKFLHASDPSEVVFVRGATEGLNLIAETLGQTRLRKGDRVVSTVMEHHSNIVPWHFLRERRGIELEFVDIDDDGCLREEEYDRRLAGASRSVVTLTHVSNVLGTVNPVREIAQRAHERGALVVLDAAQSAPHRPIDVRALGIDLLTFSGHKTLGPMGIGVLWGKAEVLKGLVPYMGGGEMIREVHTDRVLYREPPAGFEAGTPNVAGAIGLAAAIRYLEGVGWEELRAHDTALQSYALAQAAARFGGRMKVFGPPAARDREAVLSFALDGVHPHDIASLLDAEGVAVRSGHHCAQPLMERLKVPALTRASPYLYNDRGDLDRLFAGLEKVDQLFRRTTAPTAAPN